MIVFVVAMGVLDKVSGVHSSFSHKNRITGNTYLYNLLSGGSDEKNMTSVTLKFKIWRNIYI